jgi:hypothetical protein
MYTAYTAGIQSVRHVDTVDTVDTRNQTQKVQGHLQDWLNSLNFRAQLVASPVGVKLFISKKLEKTSKAGEGGNFSVKPTNQPLAEVVVCRIFFGFKMFKVEQLENADRTLDCDLPNGCPPVLVLGQTGTVTPGPVYHVPSTARHLRDG